LNHLPGAPQRDKKASSSKIIFPFVDFLKTDILKIMFDEKQDDLIPITHSCTEQAVGDCNQCWQCTERAWAFSKLHKIDLGSR
jgi:7-cyano-7-deazaguanine synthase in queuosine biosynthesis